MDPYNTQIQKYNTIIAPFNAPFSNDVRKLEVALEVMKKLSDFFSDALDVSYCQLDLPEPLTDQQLSSEKTDYMMQMHIGTLMSLATEFIQKLDDSCKENDLAGRMGHRPAINPSVIIATRQWIQNNVNPLLNDLAPVDSSASESEDEKSAQSPTNAASSTSATLPTTTASPMPATLPTSATQQVNSDSEYETADEGYLTPDDDSSSI